MDARPLARTRRRTDDMTNLTVYSAILGQSPEIDPTLKGDRVGVEVFVSNIGSVRLGGQTRGRRGVFGAISQWTANALRRLELSSNIVNAKPFGSRKPGEKVETTVHTARLPAVLVNARRSTPAAGPVETQAA